MGGMMRILHIETINHVASTYAPALDRRGHVSTIYKPSLRGAGRPLPIKLTMMPTRVLDLRHVLGKLNRDYFDVVHIHWASYGILGLASKVPVIVQCHGSDVRERLKAPLFRAMLAPVFRRAGAVLCITPDLLPIVKTLRSDAIFFPAAVDTERFSPENDTQTRPWTILLLARLDPTKGTDIAMAGIQAFADRHSDVRVLVLDWGPLREVYRNRCGARYDFIPRVAPDAVPQLIQQSDVVVGQFAVGSLGLSELQAMSCAKPVIASFRYPDAYDAPPPLCVASTANEVDAQLERLYGSKEEGAALGRRARDWILRHHDCNLLAERLENLYQSVLDDKLIADTAW
jgi:glycosyltransferase involved in cell wall biosynthesis